MSIFGEITQSEIRDVREWVDRMHHNMDKGAEEKTEMYNFDFFKEIPRETLGRYRWESQCKAWNKEKRSFGNRSTASALDLSDLVQEIPDIFNRVALA